jgi:hypothetical protein
VYRLRVLINDVIIFTSRCVATGLPRALLVMTVIRLTFLLRCSIPRAITFQLLALIILKILTVRSNLLTGDVAWLMQVISSEYRFSSYTILFIITPLPQVIYTHIIVTLYYSVLFGCIELAFVYK